MFEKQKSMHYQGLTCADRALRELLLLRVASPSSILHPRSPPPAARWNWRMRRHARTVAPLERDYIRAHWLLEAAHRVAGEHKEAERHLHEALERCRRINNVEQEADILIDLARLRAATGAPDEAGRLAEKARMPI